MSDSSAIEWTDATWNPVTGCTKVSQGCKHCYAERGWARLSAMPGTVYHGRVFTDVRCHPERLETPLRWQKPRRIFVNSMSDLFHEGVPDDFIVHVFITMALADKHTFQILTKRPGRMANLLNSDDFQEEVTYVEGEDASGHSCYGNFPWPLPNVWLGVSCEDQATADERIPLLLQTPAAVRWISAEPMLSEINLDTDLADGLHALGCGDNDCTCGDRGIDWVVSGGESGPKARPSHPDWFRLLRNQCKAAGVPFFFKQHGEYLERADADPKRLMDPFVMDRFMTRVGKKLAGRMLDGRTWDESPA